MKNIHQNNLDELFKSSNGSINFPITNDGDDDDKYQKFHHNDNDDNRSSSSKPYRKISWNITTTTTTTTNPQSSLHRSNSLIRFKNFDLSNYYHSNSNQNHHHHDQHYQTSTPSIYFKNIINDNHDSNQSSSNQINDQSKIDQQQQLTTTLNIKEDIISLLPYNHQVGGHTQIMLLNQYTLCKPLIPKELDFYLNIPRQLIDFVPRYKGVVKICHNESMLPILYHPIRNLSSSLSNNNKHHQSNENQQQKPELRVRLSICNDDHRLLESIRIDHFEQQQQQRGYSSRPNQKYFMLLENITSNYHLPCILDLKMGTRQHSDDASDEKRRRQMAKCASTTSATLGIRICGMQVYQKKLSSTTSTTTTSKNNGQYKLYQRDKYHGRRIKNENGFRNELEIYFHNRTYLIRPIISRLKQLKLKIIETLRQTTLRFFSTSLLIVTEGCLDVVNRHNQRHHHHHHRRFSDDEEDEEEEDADSNSDDSDDEHDNYFYQYDNFYTAQNDIITNNDHDDDDDDDDDDECTSSSLDSMTEESPSTSTSFNNVDNNNKDILFNCNRDHPHHHSRSSSSATTCTNNNIPGFDIRIDNLIRLLNEILFDAIRARVSMNHNHHHQQQRLNKRRRSSNGQNWLQFPHIYPTNKKLINCNFNNNNDNDDCDD
ncbi:hypothetical protein DERP_005183 [Dermatophagoides pteronyssinus]|uniref:Kinase n=1 Tax=Dermatophagoides pteronyssinus TaxID=6956 RepID=A0ABQ8JMG9_DERPT|nr:hypothetical protein DERP_005183 [Dermatophagoides pteronyssinus]